MEAGEVIKRPRGLGQQPQVGQKNANKMTSGVRSCIINVKHSRNFDSEAIVGRGHKVIGGQPRIEPVRPLERSEEPPALVAFVAPF